MICNLSLAIYLYPRQNILEGEDVQFQNPAYRFEFYMYLSHGSWQVTNEQKYDYSVTLFYL